MVAAVAAAATAATAIGSAVSGPSQSSTPYSQSTYGQSLSPNEQYAQNRELSGDYNLADNSMLTPYYPGETYAGLNGQQTSGINSIYNLGFNGNPALNQATNTLAYMAQGGATNPYLDATYDQAAKQVQGTLNGQFNSAGRLGSGSQFFDTSQGLNNLATDIYGGQYNNDQTRALSAAEAAPANYNAQLTGQQAGYNAAGQLQNDQQQQINAGIARYNATTPLAAQQNFQSLIGGVSGLNSGMTNTSTQNGYTNPTANTLGYATSGINSLSSLFNDAQNSGSLFGNATFAAGQY